MIPHLHPVFRGPAVYAEFWVGLCQALAAPWLYPWQPVRSVTDADRPRRAVAEATPPPPPPRPQKPRLRVVSSQP